MKQRQTFSCQQCGSVHTRWAGRCDECGAWNSLVEEALPEVGGKVVRASKSSSMKMVPLNAVPEPVQRHSTGISELDRVLGDGLVAGSAVLIGGEPGIGKSTLMLQLAAGLARSGKTVCYVTGEESLGQVQLRAARLSLSDVDLQIAAETRVETILTGLKPTPDCLIIDSVQTLVSDRADSAAGTVTQLRLSAQALIARAKASNMALFLIGHVTKDGQIAGPRLLEHMVDAVLYFESSTGHLFRLLRAVKNRFGAAQEIGVFEMQSGGLVPVTNPSSLFLPGDLQNAQPGSSIYAGMEGSRPILMEIQALVAPSTLANPRRAAVGYDSTRLSMLLAVLSARAGISVGSQDVFVNIAGGLKISEPAADLAVLAALLSSIGGQCGPTQCVYFGEVTLAGEIRQVSHADSRFREAVKLGFSTFVVPNRPSESVSGLAIREARIVHDLTNLFDLPPPEDI